MRILVTNDDGIDAQGLKVLVDIARELSSDVWVVAPQFEQSGKSRSLTIGSPLRFDELGDKRFQVSGTPVDCVIMAVRHLMEGTVPDLVLSGINHGANLAEDACYSGTVGGAIEGAMLGIPSIALSQVGAHGHAKFDFSIFKAKGARLLRQLLKRGWARETILNVNVPNCPLSACKGAQFTVQGRRNDRHLHIEQRIDMGGKPYCWYGWPQNAETDPEVSDLTIANDQTISISSLQLDLNVNSQPQPSNFISFHDI